MAKRLSDQVQTDHKIEEILPSQIVCPKCGTSGVKQTFSKRGIHFLCNTCGWDSNKVFDLFDRELRIKQCAVELKRLFPKLNFVANTMYAPDSYLTGQLGERSKQYDLGVFWIGGQKISRLRIEVNRHINRKRFMETEECYVIGRSEVVDYLYRKNAIVVHFLVDETKYRIGMSRIKVIKDNCSKTQDRFENLQYSIPQDKRGLIITFNIREMEDLLFKDFHRILYKNAQIW